MQRVLLRSLAVSVVAFLPAAITITAVQGQPLWMGFLSWAVVAALMAIPILFLWRRAGRA